MSLQNPQLPKTNEQQSVGTILSDLIKAIRAWFHDMLDLQEGLDREGTIVSIKNNKRMKGANAWMLGCSIMIASLGLDLNSPAVIIGAMLVSPLMSPILGIGLGVAINDKDTLFTSLRHFGLAIIIALVTSTAYFYFTPFGQVTSEIQSRTSPTFLDGLVAVFGGLAGIISVTRKDKSNAIPGVAIATALMPPLCVTGFGLAELFELFGISSGLTDKEYNQSLNTVLSTIGGSFYLFFLNSFFITITTYLIIRLLGFPLRSYVNIKEARRNRLIIALFSIIITLPSAWILHQLYAQQQDKQEVDTFIEDYFAEACIKHDLTPVNRDTNKLILQLLGRRISEDSIIHYEQVLQEQYNLNRPIKLYPMQAELSMEDLKNSLREQKQEVVNLLGSERKLAEQAIIEKQNMELELQKMQSDSAKVVRGLKLAEEAFSREIVNISYSEGLKEWEDSVTVIRPHTFLVDWRNNRPTDDNKTKLEGILKVGTELDSIHIILY
jgi:uncharacterized hydrophobic protein (TIGR00271 family)